MLHNAWDKVTETTIQNCFKHAKFATTQTDTDLTGDDEDPEDDIPLAILRLRIPFEDYALSKIESQHGRDFDRERHRKQHHSSKM